FSICVICEICGPPLPLLFEHSSSALIRVQKKSVPARAAKVAEGVDVAVDDDVRVGVGGDGAFDAGFAEQVQGGVGRAVGEVGDVVRFAAGKLVLRVEARHLQLAFQAELRDQVVGQRQEVVVVKEVLQHAGVHDQRGVHLFGRRVA